MSRQNFKVNIDEFEESTLITQQLNESVSKLTNRQNATSETKSGKTLIRLEEKMNQLQKQYNEELALESNGFKEKITELIAVNEDSERRVSNMLKSVPEFSFMLVDLELENRRLVLANEQLAAKLALSEQNLSTANMEKLQFQHSLEDERKLSQIQASTILELEHENTRLRERSYAKISQISSEMFQWKRESRESILKLTAEVSRYQKDLTTANIDKLDLQILLDREKRSCDQLKLRIERMLLNKREYVAAKEKKNKQSQMRHSLKPRNDERKSMIEDLLECRVKRPKEQ